jgi:signal transduction histidine kinase
LGLFIASSLTERSGGQLVVESQALNGSQSDAHSTTFTLSLPLDNRPLKR